ncbi:uncharacterized protein LOC143983302 [Lithobates pipiens]
MKNSLHVYKRSLLTLFCIVLQADGQNIVVETQHIKGEIGQSVTLSCGEPELSTFFATWIVSPENENLESNTHYKDRVEFTKSKLYVTIRNLTKEDSRTYCCTVETVNKRVKQQIMLEVGQALVSKGSKDNSCNLDILYFVMEILRIICLFTLSILLGIAVKTSC